MDVESIIFDENDVQDFVTVNSLIGINGTWLKTYKLKHKQNNSLERIPEK